MRKNERLFTIEQLDKYCNRLLPLRWFFFAGNNNTGIRESTSIFSYSGFVIGDGRVVFVGEVS